MLTVHKSFEVNILLQTFPPVVTGDTDVSSSHSVFVLSSRVTLASYNEGVSVLFQLREKGRKELMLLLQVFGSIHRGAIRSGVLLFQEVWIHS